MIRQILMRCLKRSNARREDRARQESFRRPVLLSAGRDSMRYFDRGRVTTIGVEWIGDDKFQVYSKGIVRWEGQAEPAAITDDEKQAILDLMTEYFTKSGSVLVESPCR